jgi:hypothetical protein
MDELRIGNLLDLGSLRSPSHNVTTYCTCRSLYMSLSLDELSKCAMSRSGAILEDTEEWCSGIYVRRHLLIFKQRHATR